MVSLVVERVLRLAKKIGKPFFFFTGSFWPPRGLTGQLATPGAS